MNGTPKTGAVTRGALSIFAITLLALGAHWRALQAGYHLDDFFRATDNPGIESVSPLSRHFTDPGTMATLPHLVQYRPLLPLSLSLSHAAATSFGIEPVVAHHAGNLLLHLLAVALVFLLTRALMKAEGGEPPGLFLPTAAAALFAAHPVAGVAVNYVSNRDLLLALVFVLGALLAYTRAAKTREKAAWLTCGICLVGALFSKQNAALFPLIALSYELTIGRRSLRDFTVWTRVGSLALLVAVFLASVRYGIGFSDVDQLVITREPFEYPLTELRLHLSHYVRNLVWPLLLHPLPKLDPAGGFFEAGVLLGALFIALAILAAWRSARSHPLLAFCVFAYFSWLVMTSSVIPMRSFAEDYRQLISLPFACVLGAACFSALPRAARNPGLGLACLLLVFASNTNARYWETEETLWGRAIELGTTSQGHLNYGRSIYQTDPALAEDHYRRSIGLSPGNVYAKINLALLLVDTGRVEEGVKLAKEAAKDTPDWGVTQYWLARCLIAAGRSDEAMEPAARARELEPEHAVYASFHVGLLRNRAETLQAEGRAGEAIAPASLAYELEPEDAAVRELLAGILHKYARALQVAGQIPASLPPLQRLHAIVDQRGDSRFLHGWALQSEGSLELAVIQYREHLRVDRSHAKARLNMAYALRDLGRPDEAVAELRTLLSEQPEHVDARSLLESLSD